MSEDYHKARRSLILLYLTVKVRKESDAGSISTELLIQEESALNRLPLTTIVQYIKASIDTIVAMKLEEEACYLKSPLMIDKVHEAKHYETLLRKEESEIRQHISIENQLKLNLEKALEDCEALASKVKVLKQKINTIRTAGRNEGNNYLASKQFAILSEEYRSMQIKLQHFEEKQLNLLLKEQQFKRQLKEKDNEIKRLISIMENKAHTCSCQPSHKTDIGKAQGKAGHSHSASLKITAESKPNSKDKTKSASLPHTNPSIVLEKKAMEAKIESIRTLIDNKATHSQTRNKEKKQRSCASASFLKDRTLEKEFSITTKRNEELTQRLNEATMKVLRCTEKRGSVKIKRRPMLNLIKNLHLKAKPTVIHTLHKKTRSAIPLASSQPEVIKVNCNSGNPLNVYSSHNDLFNAKGEQINQINLRQYIFEKCGSVNIINKYRGKN